MTDRDFAAEMRALIDAETASGSYISRVVAEHVVSKLRATDQELLHGWLDAQAESFVWQFINDRDRSLRARARSTSKSRAFAGDAERHEAGEPHAMARWLNVPFVVADGSRKPLGDMAKDDLLFVADAYDARARETKMTASFARALARKVKTGVVRDHFTDEQLSTMWQSLSG